MFMNLEGFQLQLVREVRFIQADLRAIVEATQ